MNTKCKLLSLSVILVATLGLQAQDLKGKKVLHIDSYHAGFVWSDGMGKAIKEVIQPTGAEIKTVFLDTYRKQSAEHLTQASAEFQTLIQTWKPDVVIVSDDAAMKGVYKPLFHDKDVPFVFCGVNWTAAAYGVPNKNITGMLEVCSISELLTEMKKLRPGKTIGFLGSDTLTAKKDGENCARILGVTMESVYVKTFAAWKQAFLDLQGKQDMVLLGLNMGIPDWDEAAACKFAEENTKVVTGAFNTYMNGMALISFNKLGAEQGEWAATTAIKVMKGTSPGSIPLASNQKGELVINARIATKAGIAVPFDMLQSAKVLE